MILTTCEKDKISCIKTKPPKMHRDLAYNWDSMRVSIDDAKSQFFFHVKNSRSYFYFKWENVWYKTNIVQESGFDVWDYIERRERSFFTNNK